MEYLPAIILGVCVIAFIIHLKKRADRNKGPSPTPGAPGDSGAGKRKEKHP
jgi:hypothetical protein